MQQQIQQQMTSDTRKRIASESLCEFVCDVVDNVLKSEDELERARR